ncbi:Arf-GAP with Rho-GAP domain, ANK repeat and PH domain-containing protein 2 [Balamuthia mandrillaris]
MSLRRKKNNNKGNNKPSILPHAHDPFASSSASSSPSSSGTNIVHFPPSSASSASSSSSSSSSSSAQQPQQQRSRAPSAPAPAVRGPSRVRKIKPKASVIASATATNDHGEEIIVGQETAIATDSDAQSTENEAAGEEGEQTKLKQKAEDLASAAASSSSSVESGEAAKEEEEGPQLREQAPQEAKASSPRNPPPKVPPRERTTKATEYHKQTKNNAPSTLSMPSLSAAPNEVREEALQRDALTARDSDRNSVVDKDEWLQQLLRLPENAVCAECSRSDPRWISFGDNFAVTICIGCAGHHRSLGTHIARIRSIDLDKWDEEQLSLLAIGGNKNANAFYEAFIPPEHTKPTPSSTPEECKQWVEWKYRDKMFMADLPVLSLPLPPPPPGVPDSDSASPSSTSTTSFEKGEVCQVYLEQEARWCEAVIRYVTRDGKYVLRLQSETGGALIQAIPQHLQKLESAASPASPSLDAENKVKKPALLPKPARYVSPPHSRTSSMDEGNSFPALASPSGSFSSLPSSPSSSSPSLTTIPPLGGMGSLELDAVGPYEPHPVAVGAVTPPMSPRTSAQFLIQSNTKDGEGTLSRLSPPRNATIEETLHSAFSHEDVPRRNTALGGSLIEKGVSTPPAGSGMHGSRNVFAPLPAGTAKSMSSVAKDMRPPLPPKPAELRNETIGSSVVAPPGRPTRPSAARRPAGSGVGGGKYSTMRLPSRSAEASSSSEQLMMHQKKTQEEMEEILLATFSKRKASPSSDSPSPSSPASSSISSPPPLPTSKSPTSSPSSSQVRPSLPTRGSASSARASTLRPSRQNKSSPSSLMMDLDPSYRSRFATDAPPAMLHQNNNLHDSSGGSSSSEEGSAIKPEFHSAEDELAFLKMRMAELQKKIDEKKSKRKKGGRLNKLRKKKGSTNEEQHQSEAGEGEESSSVEGGATTNKEKEKNNLNKAALNKTFKKVGEFTGMRKHLTEEEKQKREKKKEEKKRVKKQLLEDKKEKKAKQLSESSPFPQSNSVEDANNKEKPYFGKQLSRTTSLLFQRTKQTTKKMGKKKQSSQSDDEAESSRRVKKVPRESKQGSSSSSSSVAVAAAAATVGAVTAAVEKESEETEREAVIEQEEETEQADSNEAEGLVVV